MLCILQKRLLTFREKSIAIFDFLGRKGRRGGGEGKGTCVVVQLLKHPAKNINLSSGETETLALCATDLPLSNPTPPKRNHA